MVAAQAAPGIVSPVTEVISALKSSRRSLPYGPAGRADASEFAIPLSRFTTLVQQATLPDLSVISARPGLAARARGEALKVVEHEQADRRRQIALLAVRVNFANQLGQRHAELLRNLLHACPKWLFETDAGLVAADHDRALHDR